MTKFCAETENLIANANAFAYENPRLKLTKVAIRFVVPYDRFYRRFFDRKAGNTSSSQNKALNEI